MTSTSLKSFCNFAAWYSLIVPLLVGAMIFAPYWLAPAGTYTKYPAWMVAIGPEVVLASAFCLILSSLLMGFASLFGIPKLGAGLLWRAIPGILAGGGVGFFVGLALIFSGMKC